LSSQLHIAHNCIILDACCIINFYASGRMGDILASIPPSVTVAAYVRYHEARAVYTADGSGAQEAIDLDPYVDQGLLRVVDLETAAENGNYINFAANLGDDGEAITGAIVVERNWAIGTDDGAATKFFRQRCPQLQIISSLELLKHWAEAAQVGATELGQALRLVRIRGKYQPHTRHLLYDWWQAHYNK
jgi:hypothetical protein